MAKSKAAAVRSQDGVYVEKPKPDVYLAMILLTTAALIAAIAIMYLARD